MCPLPDSALSKIAEYVKNYRVNSRAAYRAARLCLADALGCAVLALEFPECTKVLGPLVKGTHVPTGCRVPGTPMMLNPVQGAFNIGTMIRWLDFNDTWLAAEWGHPSDNLGGILATADYLSRSNMGAGKKALTVRDVLTAMIKAYEIQGILALENSFNRVGLDHVILVKAATGAVTSDLMGAGRDQIVDVLSNVWIDSGPLRAYRHAPNTGSRKSWAAGDATARGTWLAMMVMKGEMGYPAALSAAKWGFYDVFFSGKPFKIPRSFGTYVIENILFKLSFPAEFHAQTAVECSVILHGCAGDRLEDIREVRIKTQEPAMRIIDKKGKLRNPADRDHCLQYMVAVGLIFGDLKAEHYGEEFARDPRIDTLRRKMTVSEDRRFTKDYFDPEKRSIANSIKIIFHNGTETREIAVEYPVGHKKRREEGVPLLFAKLKKNLSTRFPEKKVEELLELFADQDRLEKLTVPELTDSLAL
jgi:2-methylcitrate dehydratase